MGKREKQHDPEEKTGRCGICGEDIMLDYYVDQGDLVDCEECGARHEVRSLSPVRLRVVEEGEAEDEELDFN